jgi:oligo-alginate lyase
MNHAGVVLVGVGMVLVLSAVQSARAAPEANGPAWTAPPVELKTPVAHPVIAATPEELARLRAAWAGKGPAHDAVAARIDRAEAALKKELDFPPEGGQHNQWYQCDQCQTNLKTVDAHHHKCPICGKVYSGFPYDNVLYSRTHSENLNRMEDAAWAWAVTGEKRFADYAAKVLLGYADRYLKYPMVVNSVNDPNVNVAAEKHGKYKTAGHMNEQTLGEAMWMIPLATVYDLVCQSGALSAEQRRQVEDRWIRAMAECIDVHRAGKSNWQTWHNAAILWAGAVLGDGNRVRQAILDPANGFAFQMRASVMAEGMWYENSWGYHYYTLSAMTHIAEGARRLGIDLYSHPMLRKMYRLAFDYRMADGSLPRFGDAVQDSPVRPGVNEPAYAAYRDERLLSTLPTKPTWDSVLLGRDVSKQAAAPAPASSLIRGAGHAILCTDGPGRLSAAMTFGPYGGFHGHFDKLSFVFFGYGQEFGVDPGRKASQAYRLPIHRDWYKATTGHNAVLVDGAGQKEADGKLLAYGANGSYAAVAADAGPAFANVAHKRLLVLTPSYLVVIDELTAKDGKEHTFDWLYHNVAKAPTCDLPAGKAELGATAGYTYLKDVKACAPDGNSSVRVVFPGEKASLHLTMQAEKGDAVFTATGPFQSVEDRAAVTIVRRRGRSALFAAVLEPVPAGGKPALTRLVMRGEAKSMRLRVGAANYDEVRWNPGFSGETMVLIDLTDSSPPRQTFTMKAEDR